MCAVTVGKISTGQSFASLSRWGAGHSDAVYPTDIPFLEGGMRDPIWEGFPLVSPHFNPQQKYKGTAQGNFSAAPWAGFTVFQPAAAPSAGQRKSCAPSQRMLFLWENGNRCQRSQPLCLSLSVGQGHLFVGRYEIHSAGNAVEVAVQLGWNFGTNQEESSPC